MDLEGLPAGQPRDGHVREAGRVLALGRARCVLLLLLVFASLQEKVEFPRESELLGDFRRGSLDFHTRSSLDGVCLVE